ncbi:MAG: DUF72 domain-containing protein [Candidatus Brocadiales bacterium]
MIKLGTSGFSFDDWRGVVYPPKIKKQDMLRYYERELGFRCLEINSTYYTLPSQKSMEGMLGKISPGFEFTVKAFRGMTHEIWEKDRKTLIDNREVFEKFLFSMAPLSESGSLACVLAQFPPWFRPNNVTLDYLKKFGERLEGIPVVVEFRNHAWHDDRTLEFLRRNSLGYCVVDEPRLPRLMPFNPRVTSSVGYFRLHGRNPNWFNVPTSVRYDYLYSEAELKEFLDAIHALEALTDSTFVFFNNCHAGSAVRNALMLREMLGISGKSGEPALGGQQELPF